MTDKSLESRFIVERKKLEKKKKFQSKQAGKFKSSKSIWKVTKQLK
jgi:hypothetical protein